MRLLLPVPKREWRTPSQAQQKDIFGNESRTRFSVTAHLHDGHPIWKGWFDDRDDFDAFLWAIATNTLHLERALWRLPTPWWHPDFDYPGLSYSFLTTVFITSTSASNQTNNVPTDWNNGVNNIDVISAGGSGGASSTGNGSGGGGGAWSRASNVSLTPGGTATFFLNVGGAAVTSPSNGNAGASAWYNGATIGASSVGCTGGGAGLTAGTAASGGTVSTGAGHAGGSSGSAASNGGSGAGGAGGTTAVGSNGTNASANATAGGAGGAASGGSAGTSGGGTGGNGTVYDATHGAGGGGGGSISGNAGSGGNYGGGGGGYGNGTGLSANSGAGIQGLIIKQFLPLMPIFNLNQFELQKLRFNVIPY